MFQTERMTCVNVGNQIQHSLDVGMLKEQEESHYDWRIILARDRDRKPRAEMSCASPTLEEDTASS